MTYFEVGTLEKSLQVGQLLIPNRWSEHELQSDLCMSPLWRLSILQTAQPPILFLLFMTTCGLLLQLTYKSTNNCQETPSCPTSKHSLWYTITQSVRVKLEKTPHFPENQLGSASLLSYISNSEILLELLAILGADKNSDWSCIRNLRWTVVFIIEFVKYVSAVLLLLSL